MPSKTFTPRQLVRAMEKYETQWPKAIIRGFHRGLKFSHRYAITKRMAGGGSRAPSLPNKLRIRSGKLRRTVAIIPPRRRSSGVFEGGLKAGSASVIWARIHEYGGIIRARLARYLNFKTPDGKWHRVRQVRIPARPYLTPALLATDKDILREVRKSLGKLAGTILG